MSLVEYCPFQENLYNFDIQLWIKVYQNKGDLDSIERRGFQILLFSHISEKFTSELTVNQTDPKILKEKHAEMNPLIE